MQECVRGSVGEFVCAACVFEVREREHVRERERYRRRQQRHICVCKTSHSCRNSLIHNLMR